MARKHKQALVPPAIGWGVKLQCVTYYGIWSFCLREAERLDGRCFYTFLAEGCTGLSRRCDQPCTDVQLHSPTKCHVPLGVRERSAEMFANLLSCETALRTINKERYPSVRGSGIDVPSEFVTRQQPVVGPMRASNNS